MFKPPSSLFWNSFIMVFPQSAPDEAAGGTVRRWLHILQSFLLKRFDHFLCFFISPCLKVLAILLAYCIVLTCLSAKSLRLLPKHSSLTHLSKGTALGFFFLSCGFIIDLFLITLTLFISFICFLVYLYVNFCFTRSKALTGLEI
jgi:hypothetical protein